MKKLIVLSGGLDSTTFLYKVAHDHGAENVVALSFFYGQIQSVELEKAKMSCDKLNVEHHLIDISFLGEMSKSVCANIRGTDIAMPNIEDVLGDAQPDTYVPFRNLILNSISVSFAESHGCDEVYNGCQSVDAYGYWDTTKAFFNDVNSVLAHNRENSIKIVTPFIDMMKSDEIKLGVELGVPYEDTLSCYNPNDLGESCGRCPTCSERIQNFAIVGIKDPAPYSVYLNWDEIIKNCEN